jgi:hypothetical protein
MKKLLVLLGLGGLAYWFAKDRLGGDPDEFVFTEAPPPPDPDSTPPPGGVEPPAPGDPLPPTA